MWQALLGTGANLLTEGLFGKDYSGDQGALWKKAMASTQGPYSAAQASLAKALAASDKGYANAQSALTQQGAVATKALLDRERQNLASAKQSSMDRGIYSSTVYDAMNRGVNADTNSALSDLNAQLALLGSNIRIGQGQAQAGIYQNLAGLHQQQASTLAGLGAGRAQFTQQGRQGGYFDDILGMLGMIYGNGGFGTGGSGSSFPGFKKV